MPQLHQKQFHSSFCASGENAFLLFDTLVLVHHRPHVQRCAVTHNQMQNPPHGTKKSLPAPMGGQSFALPFPEGHPDQIQGPALGVKTTHAHSFTHTHTHSFTHTHTHIHTHTCCVRVGSRWFPSTQLPLCAAPQYEAASARPDCRSGVTTQSICFKRLLLSPVSSSCSRQTQGVVGAALNRWCELRVQCTASALCSSTEATSLVLSTSPESWIACMGRANSSTRQHDLHCAHYSCM